MVSSKSFKSLIIILQKMKSFQYLTTVIALALFASHRAVAIPASGNQVRSDSQSNIYPQAFPLPSGNVAVTNINTSGNQIGVVSSNVPSKNTVVISSNGNIANSNGVTLKWTSPTGGTVTETDIEYVGNQIGPDAAGGNISPSAVNIVGVQ